MGSFLSVLFGTEERPGMEEGVAAVDTFSNNNSLATTTTTTTTTTTRALRDESLPGRLIETLVDLIAPLPRSPQVFSRLRTFAFYSEEEEEERPGEVDGVVSCSSLRLLFIRPNGGFAIKFWDSTKRHPSNRLDPDADPETLADHQVVAYGSWQEDGGHPQVLDLRIDSLLYRRYVDPLLDPDQYPPAETPDVLGETVLGTLPPPVWEEREDCGMAANVRTGGLVIRARYVLTPDPVPDVESLLIATSSPPDWLTGLEMAEFPSEHPLAAEWPSLSPIDNPSAAVLEDAFFTPLSLSAASPSPSPLPSLSSSRSSALDDTDDVSSPTSPNPSDHLDNTYLQALLPEE